MSQRLISRSPDLKRLRDEGYNVAVTGGYLLVREVPYVNAAKQIKRGMLVSKLNLAGNETGTPDDHVALFAGEYPCSASGREIDQIRHQSSRQDLGHGILVDHSFSAKPQPHGRYYDYYDKVTTYAAILSGPAQKLDAAATARTFPVVEPDTDESRFNYIDTASSRAEINLATAKLENIRSIAIVGLGGTGSYVLDLVAKTPVQHIHLFDADTFSQHNAFRSPGAASVEELKARPKKVDYYRDRYANMHRGIVAHAISIGPDTVDQLRDMEFVFLCLDRPGEKGEIVQTLEQHGISFVDVGMGVHMTEEHSLLGVLRVTTSTREQRDHVPSRVSFGDDGPANDYAVNIQIAELNALNATLAVIKWKKLVGFYVDLDREHHCTYTIDGNLLTNDHKV